MFLYCWGLRCDCVRWFASLHAPAHINIWSIVIPVSRVTPCWHHTTIHCQWLRSVVTSEQVPHIGADHRMSPNNAHQSYKTFVIQNIFSDLKYFPVFQILARLRVRAARWVAVTMIVLTRMARRRDNEDRGPTSPRSSSRSWRRCLLATDIPTCRPERRSQCGPTWQNPELG